MTGCGSHLPRSSDSGTISCQMVDPNPWPLLCRRFQGRDKNTSLCLQGALCIKYRQIHQFLYNPACPTLSRSGATGKGESRVTHFRSRHNLERTSKKLHHDLPSTGRCLIFCFAPPISVKFQFQGPTLPSLHSFPSQLTIPPFRPHRVESRPKRHVRHSDVFCPAGRRSPSQASPQEGGRHGQKRSSECVISALRCHDFRLTRPRRAQGGSGQ